MLFINGATCDHCGRKDLNTAPQIKNVRANRLRSKGWKIGTYVSCPVCVFEKMKLKREIEQDQANAKN